MYCPQCGATNDDRAGSCNTCGLDLNKYREQWTDLGTQPDEGQSQPPYGQYGQQPQAYQQAPYQGPPYQQQYQGQYQAPPYQTSPYQAPQYRPAYGQYPRIPSYLGWAIAVLILCFWPTGIPAVVYASQVDNKLALGDVSGAQESSRKAKMWCWISFGIGVGFVVLGITIAIIVGLVASTASTSIY